MDHLEIRRLHATYRLTPALVPARDRLDRILGGLARDGLDRSLAELPADPEEEICIRGLEVPVELRLDAPDARLREVWGERLAQAIRSAIDHGGPDVIRYPSRRHAYVDLALKTTRGDRERTWAWRQLGIWKLPDSAGDTAATAAVVRTLASEPATILPSLRVLAAAGLAATFLDRIGEGGVLTLAAAAVIAAEVPPGALDPVADVPEPARGAMPAGSGAGPDGAAAAILARSPLTAAAHATGRRFGAPARRALAVLLVLEQDPAVVQGPRRAAALVDALAVRLATAKASATGRVADAHGPVDPDAPVEHDEATRSESASALELRRPARETEAAGLLYLLHVVGELRLAAGLADSRRTAGRPVRWWLHRLGMRLAGVRPDDPAALAFVGLAPTAAAPSADTPGPTAAERRIVASLATRVSLALARRLDRRDDPPRVLLDEVCGRRGAVVADPGWLDIRMAADAVDLGIRRAGLDLDPGFVPWLGVVVRFVYG